MRQQPRTRSILRAQRNRRGRKATAWCIQVLTIGVAILAGTLSCLVFVRTAERSSDEHINRREDYFVQIGSKNAVSSDTSRHTTDAASENTDSWLDRIEVGTMLGSGQYSYVFEAILDSTIHTSIDTEKAYVVKVSGNYADLDPDVAEENFDLAALAVEIVDLLSPHPSIPETLHFVKNTPNIFWDSISRSTSGHRANHLELPPDISTEDRERILSCTNISITVSERAVPTHDHLLDYSLNLPASMVRCFWRQLFEVLAYAHGRNVMMYDTKLWNFMLSNGSVIAFDWNMGLIYDNETFGKQSERKYGRAYPPQYLAVHCHDVNRLGKRIGEYLAELSITKNRRDEGGGGIDRFHPISKHDQELLRDMKNLMEKESPPHLKWLVDNHEYFSIGQNDEGCSLKW